MENTNLDKNNIKESFSNTPKRLCDLVEIEENNMDCVVLKVKENSQLDLIKLGCFEGDEKIIRVSKGADNTFTIFTDKEHYSWEHGEHGYTLVTKNMDMKRLQIVDCLEIDFDIYIGKNKNRIQDSLDIHSLKDAYNKTYDVEIMYWKNERDKQVIVHKNGEFFRAFSGMNHAKNTLKNWGYELKHKRNYVAETGCIVEEYSMKRIEKTQEKSNENDLQNDNENDYDYN